MEMLGNACLENDRTPQTVIFAAISIMLSLLGLLSINEVCIEIEEPSFELSSAGALRSRAFLRVLITESGRRPSAVAS